jgi:hypothetical protein
MIVRPNIVLGVPLIKPDWRKDPLEVSPGDGYLNPAAFSVPGAPGLPQLGNAPRTMSYARDPNTTFFDASARKAFRIGERGEFQLRINAINVLNHPNFLMGGSGTSAGTHAIYTTANTFVQSATFGQLFAATSGRVLRIELRASF